MQSQKSRDLTESFVQELLDTLESPVALLDVDGCIRRFNLACQKLTGFSEAEAAGRKVWDFLIIDEEVAAVRRIFTETQLKSLPTHFTNYWKTKNGDRRLLRWTNRTLRDAQDDTVGILATAVDITDLKSAERELSENQAFLRSIIDASPIAVVTIGEDRRILTFSKAAETTFGYAEKEIVGENVNILMPEPDHSQHDGYIDRFLRTGERRIIGRARRVHARRRNGEVFPAIIHVNEFVDGRRIFVGFVEDVSEQVEAEKRLNETQLQLQHAGRVGAMGEIATSIAHELNQPLTAAASLIGAVSLHLQKGACPECRDSAPLLDDAVSEIRRASDIIQQMRQFVRKKKTAKSLHNVNKIVEDAGALAIIGADADGVEVRWRLDPSVGDTLLDRVQIQQVVTNLILNAVDAMKGAPQRILEISTRRLSGWVEIAVSDTGPGLDEAVKKKLFEPFVTSKEDGMGVGLSISKTIIDAHQGEIIVKPSKSGGCEFICKLPAGPYDEVSDRS